eukprot:TRINITY_DN8990_c0_g1_i1.p1 TRINITY_DN8990_c0_g1~~TRINITY_DN8990_c0_g1_i1.p1  ORF type:complete len:268 (+),score=25.16 TRINITY_DN8990_c0_g1_i1:111-914(+)
MAAKKWTSKSPARIFSVKVPRTYLMETERTLWNAPGFELVNTNSILNGRKADFKVVVATIMLIYDLDPVGRSALNNFLDVRRTAPNDDDRTEGESTAANQTVQDLLSEGDGTTTPQATSLASAVPKIAKLHVGAVPAVTDQPIDGSTGAVDSGDAACDEKAAAVGPDGARSDDQRPDQANAAPQDAASLGGGNEQEASGDERPDRAASDHSCAKEITNAGFADATNVSLSTAASSPTTAAVSKSIVPPRLCGLDRPQRCTPRSLWRP